MHIVQFTQTFQIVYEYRSICQSVVEAVLKVPIPWFVSQLFTGSLHQLPPYEDHNESVSCRLIWFFSSRFPAIAKLSTENIVPFDGKVIQTLKPLATAKIFRLRQAKRKIILVYTIQLYFHPFYFRIQQIELTEKHMRNSKA